ncbi:MAG: FKBP-type peptidyl-prolyl cis-trans isomerase [Cytophagales bacterium]|nr:FKBP-type peptidyl-prolyl cis-trans isomerase [Cytophagales bacterium]
MKTDLYKKSYLFFFLCLTALVACNSDDSIDPSEQLRIDQGRIEEFLNSNGITAQQAPAGFYYNPVLSDESGREIETDDIVSIYYTISILDGQTLHTVDTPDDPIQLSFGGFGAIPLALEAGLEVMREGEVFDFYMPSGLSYGTYSYKNLIPSLALTRLQVRVVRVDDEASQRELETERILTYIEDQGLEGEEAREKGLYYIQTEAGEGELPNEGQNISVHYTGTFLNGEEFDSSFDQNQPLTFRLGADQVIDGWDLAFKDLREGEKGIIFIPSHLAYGSNIYITPPAIIQDLVNQNSIPPQTPPGIPPFSTLVFEVEVVDIL